jgi:hypothetical protein
LSADQSCYLVSLQRIYQRLSLEITANIECQEEILRRLQKKFCVGSNSDV